MMGADNTEKINLALSPSRGGSGDGGVGGKATKNVRMKERDVASTPRRVYLTASFDSGDLV